MTDDTIDQCAVCRHRIGKRCGRIITTETDIICCVRCVMEHSKLAHKVAYPDCPIDWHDMWDHQHVSATRAAARWIIANGGYKALKERTTQ
ncbi:hypothetical protein H7K24_06370 [Mycobacterium fragae]|uniref:Uncharacterized protein n=1 Tax=Mycobacterium fragae TaxID=1260918 RepID=A0A1X1V328_9MYCO|nr:hypothetical protein [Mycobacterium fragae]MCV7399774.1 hypothetical protein [Mycobacterium fragae]ORV63462.1 hypothetical protein AWC06_08980 [Mycobacterium fragae]